MQTPTLEAECVLLATAKISIRSAALAHAERILRAAPQCCLPVTRWYHRPGSLVFWH